MKRTKEGCFWQPAFGASRHLQVLQPVQVRCRWETRKKFSIADLKDICDLLDIDTENFKHRKAPYKVVLTNVLSCCTCNRK